MKIYFLALLSIPNLLLANPCQKIPYTYDENGERIEDKVCEGKGKCLNDRDAYLLCSESCKDSVYFYNYDGPSEVLKYNRGEYIYYEYCNGNYFDHGDLKLICNNFRIKYENPYNKNEIRNIKKYCSKFDNIENNYFNLKEGIIKVSNKVFVLDREEYDYLLIKFNEANARYENSLKKPVKISFINIMQYVSIGISSFIMILILFLFRNINKIKKQK